jgi:hypothetical protein
MTEPLLQERQREALRMLLRLAEERARDEEEHEVGHRERTQAAEAEFRRITADILARYEADKSETIRTFQEAQERIAGRFEADHTNTDRDLRKARHAIQTTYDQGKEKAEAEYEETRWTATAELEGRKKSTQLQMEKIQYRLGQSRARVKELEEESRALIETWGKLRAVLTPPPPPKQAAEGKPSLRDLQQLEEAAQAALDRMTALRLPYWTRGARLPLLAVLLWLVGGAVLVLLESSGLLPGGLTLWIAGWSVATVAIFLLLRTLLYRRARTSALRHHAEFRHSMAQVEEAIVHLQQLAEARFQREVTEATRQCHQSLLQADRHFQPLLMRLKDEHGVGLAGADEKFGKLLAGIQKQKDDDWKLAEGTYRQRMQTIEDRFEALSQEAERDHQTQMMGIRRRHEEQWWQLSQRWQHGMAWVQQELDSVDAQCRTLFPPWNDPSWADRPFATHVPRGMRFGELTVKLEEVPDGIPANEQLREMVPPGFTLPALLAFPSHAAVLYGASGDGRSAAVANLQSLMLRFLTSLPPAKVRFTIVDPVGLGENFAAFMHLADHDEDLVTSRIWTEAPHIERKLADLTEHMGNVIQKYLRNQFPSIEDYNRQAGEVAEPYRVLVVANFPVNFTLEAARRLASIAATGSNCGVYTLISVDTKQPLPHGFSLADLEQASMNLVWKDGRFRWKDPDFGRFSLQVEAPPGNELATSLLNRVGAKAREAKRVEVNFEFVAPQADEWWTHDSSTGIEVPLGRAGATRRQFLQLGHGTSQHVLIAGKTGSGKSSLLHALITNLALLYSPAEVELYLIDFKKGVEFKAYANHHLPHARVVAIESEREFGLSVLQRLDAELKVRGERFRTLGVNDLNGYRQAANGDAACPRILLIVDEFQEFFVEDDKLAQEASLLLDRLVRQGRAFGLHVLLGSQTLGGAYTLARSTIDQMAVRIALQCSEADAHLILSKDNAAARLLSRPGEAIYNDANGLVEGNDLFQIVWLPDDRREIYLRRLHELAVHRHTAADRQIVFEGNAPAEPQKNLLLRQLLERPTRPVESPRALNVWLGEAIAIKDPTCAVFRPQTANNLLVLGQHEEGALGIFAMSLISLSAQLPAPTEDAPIQFHVLDGTPVDSPNAGILQRLTDELPNRVKICGWRELPELLTELAGEVARREQGRITDAPHRFLLINGLQWFRELRRQDDDLGFSRRGEEKQVPPSRQLAAILRDGPSVNVHVLAWCDTLANLQRSFDRQGIRDFEMRVLFQMSPADSSNLIDSPLASRLGLHRALYLSDDRGIPEKFRPYGLPTREWVEEVRHFLARRQSTDTVGSSGRGQP